MGATSTAADESAKECVICMSEARDTTVLPCRHMCMCATCARMLRHQVRHPRSATGGRRFHSESPETAHGVESLNDGRSPWS